MRIAFQQQRTFFPPSADRSGQSQDRGVGLIESRRLRDRNAVFATKPHDNVAASIQRQSAMSLRRENSPGILHAENARYG